jgi:WD40 repeat protein
MVIACGCSRSREERLLVTLENSKGSINCIVFSPDGNVIASCHVEKPGSTDSEDPSVLPSGEPRKFDIRREVKVWDSYSGLEQISFNKGKMTRALGFHASGQTLFGAVDNVVKVWDVKSGIEKLILKGHNGVVRDLSLSCDGKWAASASSDGTVRIWDAFTGACVHILEGHLKGVYHVVFSPDCKLVAATGGGKDRKGEIVIWDWKNEKQMCSLAHGFCVGKALFSPDGKYIACYRDETTRSSRPGLIVVWDMSLRERVLQLSGHSDEVTCICYTPDGRVLASGSADGTVLLRDSSSGASVAGWKAYRGIQSPLNGITCITFSPLGDRLASASWDGNAKIWNVGDIKRDPTK